MARLQFYAMNDEYCLYLFILSNVVELVSYYGDCKVIKEWALHHYTLSFIDLHHWIWWVRGLLDTRPPLLFVYVYHEFNTWVYILFKQAIGLRSRFFYFMAIIVWTG